MLGAIASDPEIRGLQRRILTIPNLFATRPPPIGDRVPEKQKVDATLLGLGNKTLMPPHPFLIPRNGLDGRVRKRGSGKKQEGKEQPGRTSHDPKW
jgi:hypothetical protein